MLQKVTDFFTDVIKTFLYFVAQPLQWMFFNTPRLYEAIIATILFVKNNIPSSRELKHTYFHWSHWILSYTFIAVNYSSKLLLIVCNNLHKLILKNNNKLQSLLNS